MWPERGCSGRQTGRSVLLSARLNLLKRQYNNFKIKGQEIIGYFVYLCYNYSL